MVGRSLRREATKNFTESVHDRLYFIESLLLQLCGRNSYGTFKSGPEKLNLDELIKSGNVHGLVQHSGESRSDQEDQSLYRDQCLQERDKSGNLQVRKVSFVADSELKTVQLYWAEDDEDEEEEGGDLSLALLTATAELDQCLQERDKRGNWHGLVQHRQLLCLEEDSAAISACGQKMATRIGSAQHHGTAFSINAPVFVPATVAAVGASVSHGKRDWTSMGTNWDKGVAATSTAPNCDKHGNKLDKLGKEAAIAAITHNAFAYKSLSPELKADKEVGIAMVTHKGDNIRLLSTTLKADKEVVIAAVTQNGLAIKFLSEELRADKEVCLAAAAQMGTALLSAESESYKKILQELGWTLDGKQALELIERLTRACLIK